MDYRDLKLPATINEDGSKKLSESAVHQDINQAIYALTTAYSGRKYLPGTQFSKLLDELRAISGSYTARELCAKLGAAFAPVSDNHLKSFFANQACMSEPERIGHVGKNFFHSKKSVWNVRTRARKGVRFLEVAILEFPQVESPAWNGFLDHVKKALPNSDAVIVDLRGNGGGSDAMGGKLAELLAGQELKSPYESQWTSNTPESMQVLITLFDSIEVQVARDQEPFPAYLKEMREKFERGRRLAVLGQLPEDPMPIVLGREPEGIEKGTYDPKLSPGKPIYLLIDGECASSGESTVDFFEYNPLVKRVGENTAGYIHFGNNGRVVLPNSGVAIQMAISFNRYRDGRFIEKIGIAPDIRVPAGKDALEYAVQDYLKTRHGR